MSYYEPPTPRGNTQQGCHYLLGHVIQSQKNLSCCGTCKRNGVAKSIVEVELAPCTGFHLVSFCNFSPQLPTCCQNQNRLCYPRWWLDLVGPGGHCLLDQGEFQLSLMINVFVDIVREVTPCASGNGLSIIIRYQRLTLDISWGQLYVNNSEAQHF
jgi:hypothetical protein